MASMNAQSEGCFDGGEGCLRGLGDEYKERESERIHWVRSRDWRLGIVMRSIVVKVLVVEKW
jgi:hypothetical protein